jgi:hypothetical protein
MRQHLKNREPGPGWPIEATQDGVSPPRVSHKDGNDPITATYKREVVRSISHCCIACPGGCLFFDEMKSAD